ncbi:MAG: glutamate racemase [Oscillospiraceae bacterium]|nr:glutamate racemase [Oscillospiraceae bacterium]
MSSNLRPIGVFDSGVGGITAVKEIHDLMPGEDIIYFGDVGRVPYGNKSSDIILKYASQDISFLKSLGVKMIIAACGTVSSIINIQSLNKDLPFIGVINSACIAAINSTKNKKIGVIGTETTIKSNSYSKCIKSINKEAQVYQKACQVFVSLIENDISSLPYDIVYGIVKENLSYFNEFNIDVLILGCTHYPIIEPIISEVMGPEVKLINSGKEAVKYAESVLKNQNLKSSGTFGGKCSFFVSAGAKTFFETASRFLGYNVVGNAREVNIGLY